MNEEQKLRMEYLKSKVKQKIKEKELEDKVLYKKCIQALGSGVIILSGQSSSHIVKKFCDKYPIGLMGRIKWGDMKNYRIIDEIPLIKNEFSNEKVFYIIWDEASLPVIKCKFKNIIDSIYDVTAVSFDTWLVSEDYLEVIEFYHEGEITIGRL